MYVISQVTFETLLFCKNPKFEPIKTKYNNSQTQQTISFSPWNKHEYTFLIIKFTLCRFDPSCIQKLHNKCDGVSCVCMNLSSYWHFVVCFACVCVVLQLAQCTLWPAEDKTEERRRVLGQRLYEGHIQSTIRIVHSNGDKFHSLFFSWSHCMIHQPFPDQEEGGIHKMPL